MFVHHCVFKHCAFIYDQLLDALDLHKAMTGDKDFLFMHCFKILRGCKKWDRVRVALKAGKNETEAEEGLLGPAVGSAASASEGRPIGQKKAKLERSGAASLAGFDSTIKEMMESFTLNNKECNDRSDALWKAMLGKQEAKLEIERERVQAAKIEAQAGMLKAMNDAAQFHLVKMTEEAKILSADLSLMDPLARSWHEMYRERIAKELAADKEAAKEAAVASEAAKAAATPSATATPTSTPSSAPMTGTTLASPMVIDESSVIDEPEVIQQLAAIQEPFFL